MQNIGIIGEGKMGTNLFYYLLDFDFRIVWLCSQDADVEKIQKAFQKKISRFFLKNSSKLTKALFHEVSCKVPVSGFIFRNYLFQTWAELLPLKKASLEREASLHLQFLSPSDIIQAELLIKHNQNLNDNYFHGRRRCTYDKHLRQGF